MGVTDHSIDRSECRAENPLRARLFHMQSDQHMAAVPEPYTVFLR